jgi:hypothetical protein
MPEPYDELFLRRAIELSEAAAARSGRPFSAILCDGDEAQWGLEVLDRHFG